MTNQTDILATPAADRIDTPAQAIDAGPQLSIDQVAAG